MHISIFDSLRHFQTRFLQVSVVIFAIIANLQHFSNFIKNKFENRLCKLYRLLYYFFRLDVDNIILCITSYDTCHHQYNHMRFVSFIYHTLIIYLSYIDPILIIYLSYIDHILIIYLLYIHCPIQLISLQTFPEAFRIHIHFGNPNSMYSLPFCRKHLFVAVLHKPFI